MRVIDRKARESDNKHRGLERDRQRATRAVWIRCRWSSEDHQMFRLAHGAASLPIHTAIALFTNMPGRNTTIP